MKMKKLQQMMQKAQAMQEQFETEMDGLRFEGAGGGGTVRVVMNGKKQVDSVTIDPQAVDPEDVELLQDLVVRAFNDASQRVDEKLSEQTSRLGGGLF